MLLPIAGKGAGKAAPAKEPAKPAATKTSGRQRKAG
jgi:hypothetical protein